MSIIGRNPTYDMQDVVDHLNENGFFYRIVGLFKKYQLPAHSETCAASVTNYKITQEFKKVSTKYMTLWQTVRSLTLMESKKSSGMTSRGKVNDDISIKVAGIPGIRTSGKRKFIKISTPKSTYWLMPYGILVKPSAFKPWEVLSYSSLNASINKTDILGMKHTSDSEVSKWTWKFVNKKGGPDKRFKDNKKIPILKYGILYLSIGESEFQIYTSNNKYPAAFKTILDIIKEYEAEDYDCCFSKINRLSLGG